MFGGRAGDTIASGAGDDLLYGDDLGFNNISGDDTIDGGTGNDILYGGRGSDRMTGGDDDDILYGQAGGDNMSGGSGNDILHGDDADTNSNDRSEEHTSELPSLMSISYAVFCLQTKKQQTAP